MSVTIRERKLKNGRTKLYLDIYDGGKRTFESLKLFYDNSTSRDLKKTIFEAALKKKNERERELIESEFGLQQIKRKSESFFEYFQNVIDLKKAENKSHFNYHSALLKLKEFTNQKELTFREIDETFIEKFKIFLISNKLKNGTINSYLNKISAVLYKAVREKIISYNPTEGVKRPRTEESERIYLTEDEIKKLIETPCEKNDAKRAFLFSCFTGLRISDIKKLTWGEIRENKIHFRQKKTGGFEYLPLGETARRIISGDLEGNIIPMPNAKIFNLASKGRVNIFLRLWAAKAGIDKHITFHVSRHTFATLALTKGADLYTVSKLLGHRDISTTQIYAKIVDQKLNEAMNLLPVIAI